MRTITEPAYAASIELARERGQLPALQREPFLAAPFVARLPAGMRDGIAQHGMRNSHLTAIAPAGTISLVAGGVSSGVEPIFALEAAPRAPGGRLLRRGSTACPALPAWRSGRGPAQRRPTRSSPRPPIGPEAQLLMQAALQPHVDNAISKTTNVAGRHRLRRSSPRSTRARSSWGSRAARCSGPIRSPARSCAERRSTPWATFSPSSTRTVVGGGRGDHLFVGILASPTGRTGSACARSSARAARPSEHRLARGGGVRAARPA